MLDGAPHLRNIYNEETGHNMMVFHIEDATAVDIPVMFIVMGILCIPALLKEKLSRWQGVTLLAIYVGFTIYQFVA